MHFLSYSKLLLALVSNRSNFIIYRVDKNDIILIIIPDSKNESRSFLWYLVILALVNNVVNTKLKKNIIYILPTDGQRGIFIYKQTLKK